MSTSKSLAELLEHVADEIDDVPREELQTLLRRAAFQLRAAEARGLKRLEHIPVFSYHLLRRLAQGPVCISALHGAEENYAVDFLVSRGLAQRNEAVLSITSAGRAMGEIEDEREGPDGSA